MRRPSPALVVAVIALIVAMSGTSYAVTQLPRNSVGAKQLKRNAVTAVKIKNNAVTAAKIRNNAVTGAKVEDGSLTSRDFAAGTLLQGPAGPQGATGATGATGPQGPQGVQGATGPSGLSVGAAVIDVVIPAVELTGARSPVLTLSAPSGGGTTTGTITVGSAARLVISADLVVQANVVAVPGSGIVQCDLEYSVAGSGVWTDVEYSWYSYATVPVQNESGTPAPGRATVPLSGAQNVAPGDYDVRVMCVEITPAGGNTDIDYLGGQMTVVATDQ